MPERSKLVSLKVRNLGCIGPHGLDVALDNIVCLVGRNNTGKSMVLRAYELAQGNKKLDDKDRCQWTPQEDFPEVELVVHIPDGIGNVAAKWKKELDGLKLVRSRWQWREKDSKPVRQTWDPEANDGLGEWAEDGKAGGADEVFKSRLPQPVRVDSLGDATSAHTELLKLVTEPVATLLKQMQENPDSELRRAIEAVAQAANVPVREYQEEIDRVGQQVGKGFKGVFPELDVNIKVAMQMPTIDPVKSLTDGSSIHFIEGTADTVMNQQGTGSRRALFWTLLHVRNTIMGERNALVERQKEIERQQKEIEKQKGLREKEKTKKQPDAQKIGQFDQSIADLEAALGASPDDPALPGHILLIDEPENALHPMAVRAARKHLYALASDPNWQVMLTTHSPYFIDPLGDHTTILRLERAGHETTPRTFRTSTTQFSPEDRANLRALIQLDSALAEMFFGSYPILIEGDTELAAFIAAVIEENDVLSSQVTLVPARGKGLLAPLVRLLTHFSIPFGIVHDTDGPRQMSGKANGAWTQNKTIAEAIIEARTRGVDVRHRISVPDFERRLGGLEESKDKPILAYRRVSGNAATKAAVKELFLELYNSEQRQPLDALNIASTADQVLDACKTVVSTWAKKEDPNDTRYHFPA